MTIASAQPFQATQTRTEETEAKSPNEEDKKKTTTEDPAKKLKGDR